MPRQSGGFYAERFPVVARVRMTWRSGLAHEDEIKGWTGEHALGRARDNWEGAEVECLGVRESTLEDEGLES